MTVAEHNSDSNPEASTSTAERWQKSIFHGSRVDGESATQ